METAPAAPRRRFDLVAYLKLFRFPLVFTAIADSAAGYLLGGLDGAYQGLEELAWLALVSGALYCFGMASNDIADRTRDRELAPGRMIPSGRLSLRAAVIASGALLLVSLTALLMIPRRGTLQPLAAWALTVGAIVAYNFFLKAPPTMGLVRALNFMIGLTAALSLSVDDLWKAAVAVFPLFLYVTSLTYVSTLEEGAISRRRLVAGACGMGAGALLATGSILFMWEMARASVSSWDQIVGGFGREVRISLPAVACAVVLIGWIAFRASRARDRKGIMLLVRDGVAGIILLDATLVMSTGLVWEGLGVAALLIPAAASVAIFKKLA